MKKFSIILWNNQQGSWRNWQNKARKNKGCCLVEVLLLMLFFKNVTCNLHAHLMKGIYFFSLREMLSLIHAYICI
jgi:hypothetical protein